VRVEGRRLYLCGTVKLRTDVPANKRRSEVCTSTFPPYIVNQINKLTPERQAEFFARYEQEDKVQLKLMADAVAGVRSIFDQRKDSVLSDFGINKKREKKRRPPESSLVPLLLPVVAEFVQTSRARFVQTLETSSYTAKNGSVHTPASLLSSESRELLRAAAASPLVEGPPARAVAAAAESTPFAYPITLAKARGYFPTVDEPFVLKLAAIAQNRLFGITDDELANCVVKKPGQKSEGLFLSTVGPRVQALNEYLAQQAEERGRKPSEQIAEPPEARRRRAVEQLADPKLPTHHRKAIFELFPELVAEYATRGAK
jgi:hypothetical protein